MPENPSQVTMLLMNWQKGDQAALDQLISIVYQDLKKLARKYLRNERADMSLQPTALIHEAYLRLVNQQMPEWKNRAHFYGVAAHLMREILVDHARVHQAAKRGGKAQNVPLEDALLVTQKSSEDFLKLDAALKELSSFDPRKSRVLELYYFGGLNQLETAEVLQVSERTVRNDLRLAEAWLQEKLT